MRESGGDVNFYWRGFHIGEACDEEERGTKVENE